MTRKFLLLTAGALALAALSGCDNGPSAVRTRDRDAAAPGGSQTASYASTGSSYDRGGYSRNRGDRGGSGYSSGSGSDSGSGTHDTWWASSRRHPSAESAAYHFERDGADFGAKSLEDYVGKAHAFVAHPPRGTLTMERRNGDVLMYDPKANVFAVATRDGAPRTMFKPRDGAAYWEKQKSTLDGRSTRSGRSGRADDQSG